MLYVPLTVYFTFDNGSDTMTFETGAVFRVFETGAVIGRKGRIIAGDSSLDGVDAVPWRWRPR